MDHQNNKNDLVSAKPEVLKEIRNLMKATVLDDLSWYRMATVRPMVAHRFFGTLVIALSVSLPLLATMNFERKDLVISLIGIMIAFISGIRSFFRWGEMYMANMRGMVELKNKVSEWELAIIQAENHYDPEESVKIAFEASRQLLVARDLVDKRNTEDYSQFLNALEKKDS